MFQPIDTLFWLSITLLQCIDVEINTERSIEEEFAQPIGVDYMDPQPVCVCPDLGEENLVKIAETAYGILKCETELN